jgi:hypothetical protein
MCEISDLFLDTASNNIQLHEYYFRIHEILLFDAIAVQTYIFQKKSKKRNKLKKYSKLS